jgi:hypothetical protein
MMKVFVEETIVGGRRVKIKVFREDVRMEMAMDMR